MTSHEPGQEPDQDPERDQHGENLPPTHQPYGTPSAPQNPYGAPAGQDPYGAPPAQNPNEQNPYEQDPYEQDPQGQQPGYGQAPYGQPGYPQPGYGYGVPAAVNHPSATTALVLSLIGLAGIAFCGGITLVLSPFAWRIGARAVREIDESQGRIGGREQANAGKIMGLIGTVLLALGILLLIGFIGLVVASRSVDVGPGTRAG